MKNEKEKFMSLFRKREQVFVGFRGGSTHGYVSSITDHGFGLVQLNHSTEYIYNWKNFEFICHPGFVVRKLNEVTAAYLFSLKPTCGFVLPEREVRKRNKHLFAERMESDIALVNPAPYDFKPEEIRRISIHPMRADLLVGNYSGSLALSKPSLFRYSDLKGDIVRSFNIGKYTEAIFKKEKCFEKKISAEKLKSVREDHNVGWQLESSYEDWGVGDPWKFTGKYTGNLIWESRQGFLMTKNTAELFLGL